VPASSAGPTESKFVKPDVVIAGSRVLAPMPAGATLEGQAGLVKEKTKLKFGSIKSRDDLNYYALSGTSMAAAEVSGVAALLIDPLDADAHAGIGQIHLNAGRYTDAIEALRRAVDVSPNHVEARYALATALMRSGKTREAAQEFERVEDAQRLALAERRRNMSLDVLKEEGALRAAEGRYDLAVGLYEKAATFGNDPAVYRQLADLYSKLGRSSDAARARAMYEKVAP
jgi:tetratricopeptide (TPR) repeat protein